MTGREWQWFKSSTLPVLVHSIPLLLIVAAINSIFLQFYFGALFFRKFQTDPNDLPQNQRIIPSRSAKFSRAGFSFPHRIWWVSCTTASFKGVGTFASFPFLTTKPFR